MNERIRLRNPQKFNVGIVTPDKPYGQNIPAGGFTIINQDELDYLMGNSTLLQKGVLQVEGEKNEETLEAMGIDAENNANFMSDEDIRKKLSGNANQLKKWLESTEAEPYVLTKIAEIAKGMNLSANKLQVLKAKIPNADFLNE